MADSWKLFDTFPSRLSAEAARAAMEANGIDAKIVSDDAGGVRPDLAMLHGVQLWVDAIEYDRAKRLFEDASPDED